MGYCRSSWAKNWRACGIMSLPVRRIGQRRRATRAPRWWLYSGKGSDSIRAFSFPAGSPKAINALLGPRVWLQDRYPPTQEPDEPRRETHCRPSIYFLAVCKSRRRTFLYAFRLILAPWGGSGAGDWLRHAVRRCLSPVLSRTAGTGTFAAKSMPLRSQSPSPGPWLIAVALSGSETDCQKLWAHPVRHGWEKYAPSPCGGRGIIGRGGSPPPPSRRRAKAAKATERLWPAMADRSAATKSPTFHSYGDGAAMADKSGGGAGFAWSRDQRLPAIASE